MKIDLMIPSDRKEENESIQAFAKFYIPEHDANNNDSDYKISALDVGGREGEPDFLIEPLNIVVEIKGIHDREEMEKAIIWSRSIEKFKQYLNQKYRKIISGSYIIRTPVSTKLMKRKFPSIAKTIIDAIRGNNENVFIEKIGTIKVSKINDKANRFVFMGTSDAYKIDAPGTISRNLVASLGKANIQLSRQAAKRKILLLVNWYIHATDEREFIEALSYSYEDLLGLKHIDEIWVQNKGIGGVSHNLIFTKEFLHRYESNNIRCEKHLISLFEKWFVALVNISDEFKEKCFNIAKRIVGENEIQDFFKNEDVRTEIVRLGEWYAKNKKYDQVIWIIDKLINDQEPPVPVKYEGDPQFNYHKLIEEGKESGVITTVLGHLAWLIRYLATEKRYIRNALSYTKILAKHKNLYIKMQAIAPLTEIAARRHWLQGYGKRPYKSYYKEFNILVFGYVRLIKQKPNYKAIAEFLLGVFNHYKDLSTKETIQVLDALRTVDDSGGLYIYFGLYRKDHFKKQNIEYDSGKVENRLRFVIRSKKYRAIQANIAWHFWQILKEDIKQYSTLETYLDLLYRNPFHSQTFNTLEYILGDLIEKKTTECTRWYKMLLDRIGKYVSCIEKEGPFEIWLHDSEKIVRKIARCNSGHMKSVVQKLIMLQQNRVFVGDPIKLLTSYTEIDDNKLRQEAKNEFQKLFELLRTKFPKVEPIIWP